jgi:hypothetical protein
MQYASRVSVLFAALSLVVGCGSEDDEGSSGGTGGQGASGGSGGSSGASACEGNAYCDDAMWLCRPGMANDFCAEELTATEIAPDGTRSTLTLPKATDPAIDCFYVYPTVALSGAVGNVTDFSNLEDIKVPVRAQAAPMSEVCAVYAPLYHQITLPTYTSGSPDQYLDNAYEDVAAAFQVFLEHHSKGRDFALLGHSQGAHMTRRLLQNQIETNDALRARLVVAMPIGPVGEITVPDGEVVGGSFTKLPLCTGAEERGCVIAYDSHAKDGASTQGLSAPAGMDRACANPASLADGSAPVRLSGSYFPTSKYQGQFKMGADDGLDTSFALYPDLFTAECAENAAGVRYLAIGFAPEAGDVRTNPTQFEGGLTSVLGLHVLDYAYPLSELVELVATKAGAR